MRPLFAPTAAGEANAGFAAVPRLTRPATATKVSDMTGTLAARAAVLVSLLALGACFPARLGGAPPASLPASGPIYNTPDMDDVAAAPAAPVTAEPLAPPPGAGPIIGEAPAIPPPDYPQARPATIAPSRSAMVGSWSARDATGSTCRVQLSSSPALDLYRATAAGCANRDLARVNAWDFRDGEVYLYQPGGAVAARLRAGGEGLSGALAKSGAPLTLTR
jgi:hypothetical protein